MAPEIWNNRPYDSSADMWALGCMMYELSSLRPPFTGNSFPELKRSIISGRYPPLPRKYSDVLTKVIGLMLKLNPRDRPSAMSLLSSAELQAKLQLDDGITTFANQAPKINGLIETIKVPVNGNLRRLGNALPRPCYPDVRPNSPTSWTVAEQQKQQRPSMPPQPPTMIPTIFPDRQPPLTNTLAPMSSVRVPLAPIPESAFIFNQKLACGIAEQIQENLPLNKTPTKVVDDSTRRVAHHKGPVVKKAAPVAIPPSEAQNPIYSQVRGAYNRGRHIPTGSAAPVPSGYPSRVPQRRIW